MKSLKKPDYSKSYENNPFIKNGEYFEHMKKYARWKNNGDQEDIDDDERYNYNNKGVAISIIKETDSVLYDSEAYVKMYWSCTSILTSLNKGAIKLLCYIMENLRPNSDTIILSPVVIMKEKEINQARLYYIGLRNLMDNKVIARTDKSKTEYYINPRVIFNGRREKTIWNYQKIKQSKLRVTKRAA